MTEEYHPKIYAYAYARVSTDDKEQNPESQLIRIRSYAKEHGITLLGEYRDESTGTNTNRNGLASMLGDLSLNAMYLDPGKVSQVIVLDADRFSRNMKDANKVLNEFDRLGVRLVYVANDSLDITTPEGYLINQVKSFGAQAFTDGHALKVKAGLERARAEGKKLGRPSKRADDFISTDMLLTFAQKGYSMGRLAKIYKCSRPTISRTLKAEGKLDEFKEYYEKAIEQGLTGDTVKDDDHNEEPITAQ